MVATIIKGIVAFVSLVMAFITWKKGQKATNELLESDKKYESLVTSMRNDPGLDQSRVDEFAKIREKYSNRSKFCTRTSWMLLSAMWALNIGVCIFPFMIVGVIIFGVGSCTLTAYDMHKFFKYIEESNAMLDEILASRKSVSCVSPNDISEKEVEP